MGCGGGESQRIGESEGNETSKNGNTEVHFVEDIARDVASFVLHDKTKGTRGDFIDKKVAL